MNNLILVNKNNRLEKNYIPKGLIEISDFVEGDIVDYKLKINYNAYEHFLEMQKDALKFGHQIFINSAYRSYEEQCNTLCHFIKKIRINTFLSVS